MDKIFDNFFNQAKTGRIKVGEFYYNINLDINYDKNKLYFKLKEFIEFYKIDSEEEILKKLVYLFSNYTYDEDLIVFIDKYIAFQKNKLNDNIIEFLDYKIILECKNYNYETPYSYNATITNGEETYALPIISFGIYDGECYVYVVQDKNKDKNTKLGKKIKRLLYKINGNVIDNDEYYKYKDSSYYPENISDVSPSAILALALFLNEISKLNISKITVVPYLPIRYEAKRKANEIRLDFLKKKLNIEELKKVKHELDLEQLRIQNNLTQKFIRNFFRLMYHFDNIEITSYPLELDGNLHITLNPFKKDILTNLGLEKKLKSR